MWISGMDSLRFFQMSFRQKKVVGFAYTFNRRHGNNTEVYFGSFYQVGKSKFFYSHSLTVLMSETKL